MLSKQLATIATDAPVELDLEALDAPRTRLRPPCASSTPSWASRRCCAICPPPPRSPTVATDYAALDSPAALAQISRTRSRATAEVAVWLTLDAGERETEGFGARVAGVRTFAAAGRRAFRLVRRPGRNARRACANFSPIPRARKSSTIPKLIELLAGPVRGIRHATMLYSYLLRPTTAKHDLRRRRPAPLATSRSPALPGEHADHLQRLAPLLRQEVEAQDLAERLRKHRPAARARPRRDGAPRHSRRSRSARRDVRVHGNAKSAPSKSASGNWPARNSTSIRRSSSPKSSSTK